MLHKDDENSPLCPYSDLDLSVLHVQEESCCLQFSVSTAVICQGHDVTEIQFLNILLKTHTHTRVGEILDCPQLQYFDHCSFLYLMYHCPIIAPFSCP